MKYGPPWAMTASPSAVRVSGVVEVQILMETAHPPTGRIVPGEGEPAQPFVGWLQLLTILADALQRPPPPRTGPSETAP